MSKYMLSNHKFSYYLYGDEDAVAFVYKDFLPRFWNSKRWVEKQSFMDFCDNAVEISKAKFLKEAAKQNADLSELERILQEPDTL